MFVWGRGKCLCGEGKCLCGGRGKCLFVGECLTKVRARVMFILYPPSNDIKTYRQNNALP